MEVNSTVAVADEGDAPEVPPPRPAVYLELLDDEGNIASNSIHAPITPTEVVELIMSLPDKQSLYGTFCRPCCL